MCILLNYAIVSCTVLLSSVFFLQCHCDNCHTHFLHLHLLLSTSSPSLTTKLSTQPVCIVFAPSLHYLHNTHTHKSRAARCFMSITPNYAPIYTRFSMKTVAAIAPHHKHCAMQLFEHRIYIYINRLGPAHTNNKSTHTHVKPNHLPQLFFFTHWAELKTGGLQFGDITHLDYSSTPPPTNPSWEIVDARAPRHWAVFFISRSRSRQVLLTGRHQKQLNEQNFLVARSSKGRRFFESRETVELSSSFPVWL